jgi:DNA modification methylase
LTSVGGATRASGERTAVAELADALRVGGDDAAARAHVHGFHSYPARMHPVTAGRLVAALSRPGARVLDPFCGSGTVLVEARLGARRAVGLDASPLAVELAWLKTRGATPAERAALFEAAGRVAASAEERRRRRAGPTRRYPAADLDLFDVHVLLELDGLRAAIEAERGDALGRALRLVLSSILTKVSRLPGDTAEALVERRLAAGFTTRLFSRRAAELCRALARFTALCPRSAPACELHLGDARDGAPLAPASVDLVATSPPYPGVYDYAAHQEARLRWLGLDTEGFRRREIGARRDLGTLGLERALSRWRRDFGACLGALARALAPGGRIALLSADVALGGRAVRQPELVAELARQNGLRVVACASQRRAHFHRATRAAFAEQPRREHLLLLARA